MKHASRIPLILSGALLLGVGCGLGDPIEPEARINQRVAAITDGQPDHGHPSVGQLIIGGSRLCTATLVGRRTVLTAAHCIDPDQQRYRFILGDKRYQVARVVRHPSFDGGSLANDIAIVQLRKAPPIAASAIATRAPTLGTPITLVGFGTSSEKGNDSGRKRVARNRIDRLTNSRIFYVSSGGSIGNTCYGDSGGPAFIAVAGPEVLAAVTTSGQPPCGVDGFSTRVDVYEDWIADQAEGDVRRGVLEAAAAGVDEARATPPPGTFGASCEDAADCHSGLCVGHDSGNYCSLTCSARGPQCPGEAACVPGSDPGREVCGLPDDVLAGRLTDLMGQGCAFTGPQPEGTVGLGAPLLVALWAFSRRRFR